MKIDSDKVNINEPTKEKTPSANGENKVMDTLFILLTVICYLGTFYMISGYDEYWDSRISNKPIDYDLPKLSDFQILIYLIPAILFIKFLFNTYTQNFMYSYVPAKFKNPDDEENYKMGLVYKKKLSTSLFKTCYYIFSVVAAAWILKDLDFIPWQLFGRGEMKNIFNNGENYLFWIKPQLFKEYYLIGLAFVLTDMIYLLFVYEIQSDFFLMLLHHSITISLIVFSYLSNLDTFGAIVFFLHDITDILVYILRISLYTDSSEFLKLLPGVLLLFSYLFYRIHLFGSLIYTGIMLFPSWNIFNTVLTVFMCILMIAHCYWVFQIIKRFFFYQLEDVGAIKKKK